MAKKISKSLGRGEVGDAARLEKNHDHKASLDHIIRERCPTFVDALRDLDDALSLIFLFANLPSTEAVPAKTVALCRRLALEFEHYVITAHCLRKSFLSIKGIYYQATIQGQEIMWIVPYKFVQRMTNDVDFRIMSTFVEFYTTLLGFVNFRLYTSVGLIYPPKLDAKRDEGGGELEALTLQESNLDGSHPANAADAMMNGTSTPPAVTEPNQTEGSEIQEYSNKEYQKQVDTILARSEQAENAQEQQSIDQDPVQDPTSVDTFTAVDPKADILPQPQDSTSTAATLFAPFTFYLSRETPRQSLDFVLRAFGCKRVGWDAVLGEGAYIGQELDSRITHQIVDRPPRNPDDMDLDPEAEELNKARTFAQGARVLGRIYVQPQWVWDCINEGRLLKPDAYAPGETLPPHLSPWVKPKEGQYDPSAPVDEPDAGDESEVEEEETTSPQDMLEDEIAEGSYQELRNVGTADDMKGASDEDDESVSSDFGGLSDDGSPSRGAANNKAASIIAASVIQAEKEATRVDTGEDDEEQTPEDHYQQDIAAEATGRSTNVSSKHPQPQTQRRGKESRRQKQEAAEELERRKMMMSRKKRKLVEKMLYGNQKREDEAEKLRMKRRKLERAKG